MRDIPYRSLLSSQKHQLRWAPAALAALVLAAHVAWAQSPDVAVDDDAGLESTAPDLPDPLQRLNRRILGLNLRVDRWVIDPITRAYVFVVPAPARRSVRHALANLNSPSIFVNDTLQLRPHDAGVTMLRFVINTTAGVVGLFDVADAIGLEGHHAERPLPDPARPRSDDRP